MLEKPLVTVLMSVYNGEKYLAEAIESILNQTFTDFEFLIINDGSTDSTVNVIASYEDPRIRLINNETNIGLTRSLNKGIELAKGKYIARMDGDDISLPERLKKQVEFMEENDDIAVCGTCAKIVNAERKVIGGFKNPERSDDIKISLFFYNPIAHPTVMLRLKKVIEAGGYNPSYLRSQDYELWVKLFLLKNNFYNLKEKLVLYREHGESITSADLQNQLFYAAMCLRFLYGEYLGGAYINTASVMQKVSIDNQEAITIKHFLQLIIFMYNLGRKLERDENITSTDKFFEMRDMLISRIVNSYKKLPMQISKGLLKKLGLR